MSNRSTYRGAGRSIKGGSQFGATQQGGNRQRFQNQGTGGNPVRQQGAGLNRLDANFLRDNRFFVAKPISDILEHFNAIMRIDIGPNGGAMPVIVPNPQLGNPNAVVPTISDLKKLSAIAAFINDAKRESVSSDTRNQAMADAYRTFMGLPQATRDSLGTTLTNNELTIIASTVVSITTLEENKKTILSNTATEDHVKTVLIQDVIRIKNASFRYLASLIVGENLRDSPIKKRAYESGVCEFMFAKLTKKITMKASDDLINFVFPRNDWLAGFYLTFQEIRDLEKTIVEKYSIFTAESGFLTSFIRNDQLMKAVNFLSEDFSFTRESEILSRLNRKPVLFLPPYDLTKVAELISAKKVGVYDGRWARKPNSLDPVSGLAALSHAFLRFKLLQTNLDVSYMLDDLFDKGDDFTTALKERPIGEEFNVGTWILRNICEDNDVDETLYDNIFTSNNDERSLLYLERYLTSQLGFLEDHRFTVVLRSLLSITRKGEALQLVRKETTSTITETATDGSTRDRQEMIVEVIFPINPILGRDHPERRTFDSIARDIPAELSLGKADTSVPDPTSSAGVFRKQFFSDSFVPKKSDTRRSDSGGSTALSAVSQRFLKDLYPKNKAVSASLVEFLKGFSHGGIQDYIVKVLHARESQLLGIDPMVDLLAAAPDHDDVSADDLFAGMEG